MASPSVNPPSSDEAAQAFAAASSWYTIIVGALSAVFSGGLVWGVTKSTLTDHGRRLDSLENSVNVGLRRIEDKIDTNHNLIVSKLIPDAKE